MKFISINQNYRKIGTIGNSREEVSSVLKLNERMSFFSNSIKKY